MKLSQKFFDVCQTAIRNCTWKGSEVEDVVRVMEELNLLFDENEAAPGEVLPKLPFSIAEELRRRNDPKRTRKDARDDVGRFVKPASVDEDELEDDLDLE